MPGSGKTTLFESAEYADYAKFDNVLAGWELKEQRIRELIHEDRSVLVSDIEFCNADIREKFQQRIGRQFDWICFENAPWKCATNCIYRYITQRDRDVLVELVKIDRLTLVYEPFGDIRVINKMSLQPYWQ